MRLLLDSRTFLWFLTKSPGLSNRVETAIAGAGDVRLSYVSLWQMTIERAAGRLDLLDPLEEMATQSGISLLPIELHHIRALTGLPRVHEDPFDRLLIAQAIEEGLVLVTGDPVMQRYPVAWLW